MTDGAMRGAEGAAASVERSRAGFNAALLADGYAGIHHDDAQRDELIPLLAPEAGKRYLDLGCGNGYMAFALARACPGATVKGLDIAELAVAKANEEAKNAGLANLGFRAYDGLAFPYGEAEFDGIVSRYALHHFPDLAAAADSFCAALKPGGVLLVADVRPHPLDPTDFADRYMRLKDDGHQRMLRVADWEELLAPRGLRLHSALMSEIRFPRPHDGRYDALFAEAGWMTASLYDVKVEGGQVWITLPVAGLRFRKG